jgi:hypothetical protein
MGRAVLSERAEHKCSAGVYREGDQLDAARLVSRVGEEVEHGAVVPDLEGPLRRPGGDVGDLVADQVCAVRQSAAGQFGRAGWVSRRFLRRARFSGISLAAWRRTSKGMRTLPMPWPSKSTSIATRLRVWSMGCTVTST